MEVLTPDDKCLLQGGGSLFKATCRCLSFLQLLEPSGFCDLELGEEVSQWLRSLMAQKGAVILNVFRSLSSQN